MQVEWYEGWKMSRDIVIVSQGGVYHSKFILYPFNLFYKNKKSSYKRIFQDLVIDNDPFYMRRGPNILFPDLHIASKPNFLKL